MSRSRTNEEKAALFDGVSISVLAAIFGKDKRTVSQAIRDVPASDIRDGHPVYKIADVAPYLVNPIVNIEEYLANLNPKDLPPQLQKDFWAAQLARQKFEINKGELWSTDQVIQALAEVFKKLKTSALLFSDTVEARTELTERQRKVINELVDALLDDTRKSLLEGKFDAVSEGSESPVSELD